MKGPSLETAVEIDDEVDDSNLKVIVKCPFCQVTFNDTRDEVEDLLYRHLWKVHDSEAVQYMIDNMYIPEIVKANIFEEMGFEYISWIVDNGEIDDGS